MVFLKALECILLAPFSLAFVVIILGIGLYAGITAGSVIIAYLYKNTFYEMSNERFELEHRIEQLSKTIVKYMEGGIMDENSYRQNTYTFKRNSHKGFSGICRRKDSEARIRRSM